MITDILNSTSMERLRGLIKSRYGKGLEVSFLNDLAVVENSGAYSLKDGVLQIPVFSEGQFLALAKIPGAGTLPIASQEAISDLVRLILEPTVYRWFVNHSSVEQDTSILQPELVGELQKEVSEKTASEKSAVILMTSQNPHRIKRVAIQTHEKLGRWAFTSWSEIKRQISSVEDLKDLGAMTILVEDILLLSEDEKILLNEWVLTSNAEDEPALILGSTLNWVEIQDRKLMPQPLLTEAGFCQIQIDRLPVDRKLCEEAIQLLLDKKSLIHNH